MIEKMHEKTNSMAFKVIFALISISFVLGGIGSGFMTHDSSAVKVNGEEISQAIFSQAKTQEQNRRNELEGDKFWDNLKNPTYLAQFNREVLDRLVDEQLLRQYAQSLNLRISDEQIKQQILSTTSFHQDGKFNNAIYLQALRNSGLSPDAYAGIVREGMIMSQLQEGVVASDFSVPAQQAVLAKSLLQTRQIRTVTYAINDEINRQSASDEEMNAFYAKHSQQFVSPEKLTVEYVQFSPADLKDKISVDETQIETYYQTNLSKYATAGEDRLAHIQLTTEEEAQAVSQALKNGADFTQLAQEKSQDKGSASQGGDLGWAKSGTFPAEFETASKNLKIGQVSDVVKVDNAFHIIKLLDRKEGGTIPLAQIKSQIAETIRNELLHNEYSSTARNMANKVFDGSASLNEVAQIAGVNVQKTDEFEAHQIPAVLNHEKVVKVLNSELRKNGSISEAIELGDEHNPHIMFIRVSQYQAQAVQPFEQAKEAVNQAVKREKALKALHTKAEADLEALQKGVKTDVTFSAPESFVFAQTQQQPLVQAIFAMPRPQEKQPSYQIQQNESGDVLIIALESVTDGDSTQLSSVAPQLAQIEQLALSHSLLQDLRARAKIEVNDDFMQQQDTER